MPFQEHFKSKKDRNDFFIALAVIAFFGVLFFNYAGCSGNEIIETVSDIGSNKDKVEEMAPVGIIETETAEKDIISSNEEDEAVFSDPDIDGDGIVDSRDSCKTIAGVKSNNGCPPDKDGDGIVDSIDRCPTIAGSSNNQGCPSDQDKNGIYDRDDKCPKIKGVPENNGCPADRDGDGVYDTRDKCPDVAGVKSNNGCPEVKMDDADKEIIKAAIESVEFESGNAILKSNSRNNLNQISVLMKKYPDYKLSIHGHTDAQGDDRANINLSKARATACLEYLTSRGVDSQRMKASGYGEAKPIASNNTAEGRRQNRRVEFKLNYSFE